jgi:hypothetical protein
MSALFYRLLGQAIWTVILRYLRLKNGRLLLPRKLVFGGAAAVVLAAVIAVASRDSGATGQLRP